MASNITPRNFIPSKFMENSQVIQFTAQNIRAAIDKLTVTNVTDSAVIFSVHMITTGTATPSNLVAKNIAVAAGQTYLCPEIVGHVLEPGGSIGTIASTANALVIRASGREVA